MAHPRDDKRTITGKIAFTIRTVRMSSPGPHIDSPAARSALDVANSVVLRFDAERRIDRFDDPAAIDSFAEAANLYGPTGPFRTLVPAKSVRRNAFIGLREATDRHLAPLVRTEDRPDLLADLLEAIATSCVNPRTRAKARRSMWPRRNSALGLIAGPERERTQNLPQPARGCFSTAAATEAGRGATWRFAATRTEGQASLSPQQGGTEAMKRAMISALLAAAVAAAVNAKAAGIRSKLTGKMFVFNYRLAYATYMVTLNKTGAVPDGSTVVATFENPAGGNPLTLNGGFPEAEQGGAGKSGHHLREEAGP